MGSNSFCFKRYVVWKNYGGDNGFYEKGHVNSSKSFFLYKKLF